MALKRDKVCVYPLITCGSPECCGNSISAYGVQKTQIFVQNMIFRL